MKFNTKNLWNGYLLRSFLFVFLLLGGLSFGIPNAKAEMGFSSGSATIDGSAITISGVDDEENNVLICLSNERYYGTQSSGCSFTLGSATSSSAGFISNFHPSCVGCGVSISYLFSVENGNSNFSSGVGSNGSALECFIIEGVNVNNPVSVVASSTKLGYSGASNYLLEGVYDYNPIAVTSCGNDYGRYILMEPNEDYFISTSTYTYNPSKFSIMELTSTSTENTIYSVYSNHAQGSGGLGILNLEPAVESDIEIIEISQAEDRYLQFNPLLNFCPTNTSCLLKYNYDTALFSNSADFLKVWYYENSTSTPDYLGVQPLATKWELDILGSGYLIASSSTSTEQFSYYQVQPCQFNYPYTCAGTSTVAVQFIEQTNPIDEIENMLNATGSLIISSEHGSIIKLNPKEMACSQEEWNTPNPSFEVLGLSVGMPALNFTKIGCYTKASFLTMAVNTGNAFKGFFSTIGNYLTNIFPFGIIKNISTAWTNSASSTVPVALEWLVPVDENGNITMTIPASFIKQATSTEIVVFGPDLANSDTSWQEFASKIRGITTYLFWTGFLWGLYILGIKIYKEIRE